MSSRVRGRGDESCRYATPCFPTKRGAQLLVLCLAVVLTGCGSGAMSQADMMRTAIRRPSDDEEETTSNTTPPPNSNQSKPAADKDTNTAAVSRNGHTVERSAAAQPASVTNRGERLATNGGTEGEAHPPVGSSSSATHDSHAVELRAPGPPADAPTTPEGRQALSRQNLVVIGNAMNRYVAKKGAFPTPATYDRANRPLLSWRVELLQFLGHWDLYQEFDHSAPWDSPHNRSLIPRIPAVYQSPERWDTTTNYLVLAGRTTLFPGGRPVAPRRIDDGRENTLALVEVDDARAVTWTKPEDLTVSPQIPLRHLGTLRGGTFLGVFADGMVSEISIETPPRLLWAALTFDGGETFTAADLIAPSSVPSEPASAVARRGAAAVSEPSPAAVHLRGGPIAPSLVPRNAVTVRQPIPDDDAQRVARGLVKGLFQQKFSLAKTKAERAGVAQEMLDMVDEVKPAERYVLLDIAKEVASAGGDAQLTLDIVDRLEQAFELDGLEMKAEVAQKLTRTMGRDNVETFVDWAAANGRQALREERYREAEQLISAANNRAHKYGSQGLKQEMRRLREKVEYDRELRHEAAEALEALESKPENGTALTTLGRYLCFVKDDWENGLPVLARCSAPRLQELAQAELLEDKNAVDLLALADGWWERAEQRSGAEQQAMARRAAHWYRQSLEGLPPGLQTIRAQNRLEHLEEYVLPEEVESDVTRR